MVYALDESYLRALSHLCCILSKTNAYAPYHIRHHERSEGSPNAGTVPMWPTLHALENIGQEKLTFIVGYNSPTAADRDFVTAWASLPDEILARTVGLTTEEISVIRNTTINRLSSFDASSDVKEVEENSPFSNSFDSTTPLYQSQLGSIKRIKFNTKINTQDMAMQQTIMKPGTLRLPFR